MKTQSLATLALLSLLLTSCQPATSPKTETQRLRISMDDDPSSFDPRVARNTISADIIHMLFEGLLRVDSQGELKPGIASRYTISNDQLTYTFYLRPSNWSNGDPVTAHDFVYAWQSSLDPQFPAPNAYQLFVIKNAEAAKNGTAPVSEIGVQAADDQTLVVTLEKPTPYFPELTSFHSLFPVNRQVVQKNPNWAEGKQADFTSNGPFKLDHWKLQSEVALKKNPHYWGVNEIQLDEVLLMPLKDSTALSLYENNEIDWVGSPLGTLPPDAITFLAERGQLESVQAAGTQWLRLNTETEPLNDPRVRRALALAVDRASLVQHVVKGNQQVATAIVPPGHNWTAVEHFDDNAVAQAQELWDEIFGENEAPQITLTYGSSDRNRKIAQALQQQWRAALGIEVSLEQLESSTFFDRVSRRQYCMACSGYFADFRDPVAFLHVFKDKDNGTNNTNWEDDAYRHLLHVASQESNPELREELLHAAEKRLMDQMPVIPLYYQAFNYQKRPHVAQVAISELGVLNVRDARITKEVQK